MAYVKSKNIKMYPSGYRGILDNNTTNGTKYSYNPESKLNVESNAIRSLKTLLTYGKGDFVITENYSWNEVKENSWDSDQGEDKAEYNYFNFEFICGGYYFKIIDSYDAFKDLLSQTGVTALYAAISFANMNVFIPESKTDSRTIDDNNIYITDPHLKNQKPGESAGEELTASNLNDDASNIIDFSSLDQGDEFTGVSLSTINDDTKLHYFKILEKNSTGDFVVPQEAKLITDTKHIWGSNSNSKNKSLYDEYETGKIKSHDNSALEIEGATSVNITTPTGSEKLVNITTPKVKIKGSDNTTTEIKGNEIDTTTVKGYTNLTLTCETASSTLTLKSPKVQLVNDNTNLLVEYTPTEFSIKKQTSSTKTLSYTDTNGLVLNDSNISASNKVKITSDKVEIGIDNSNSTKISNKDIYTQDIYLTNQVPTPPTVNNALQIGSDGKVSGVTLSAAHTHNATQIVNYVDGITQAANGAITYTTSSLPKIGATSTTLQGIAQVDSIGSKPDDAHARWIKSTLDSTNGGKLYVDNINTLIYSLNATGEYPLVAKGEVEDGNWFKAGRYSNSITINSTGRLSATSFYATSDARLKENIKPLDYNKSILDLPVYTYDYINGQKNNIGCLAQDLQKLYPQLIGENSNGYLTVDNSKVVYLLLEEVKKLKKELDEIKTKLK